MQAAVVNVLGQAPQYQSFPDPVAQEGEALIKVRAAGLHPIVKARASGAHYSSDGVVPMVPGVDGVGTLEDGIRVFFGFSRAPYGSMAERTVAPRKMTIPLPDGIDAVSYTHLDQLSFAGQGCGRFGRDFCSCYSKCTASHRGACQHHERRRRV